MALRRALAGIAAVSLAAGGLMLTASAVAAAPSGGNVLESQILRPTDATEENTMYNDWHYSPSASYPGRATQGTNGLVFKDADKSIVVVGNGNNGPDPTPPPAQSVTQTIAGLGINIAVGDPSPVFYQVPVFFDHDGTNWKFTTLRQNVADGTDSWISSRALPNVAADTPAPLADIVADLGDDARAIATGFLTMGGSGDLVVNSFTNVQGTTTFAPAVAPCVANAASSNFVHSDAIRANEATYPGWHNGLTKTETVKNFVTKKAGLEVTGNAQILNGLADPAEFQANCLSAAANMQVDVADSTGPVATQVPVFYYPNGASSTVSADRLFTTIRLNDSADLGDPDALWSTSSAIYADAAKTVVLFAANDLAPLSAFVAAIGVHDVIGFGFYVNVDQSATVRSVTFNNQTTTFVKPALVQPVKPVSVETGVAGA